MSSAQITRQLEGAAAELPAHLLKNLKADLKRALAEEQAAELAEPAEVLQIRAQLAALTADHAAMGDGDVRKVALAKAMVATAAELATLLPAPAKP